MASLSTVDVDDDSYKSIRSCGNKDKGFLTASWLESSDNNKLEWIKRSLEMLVSVTLQQVQIAKRQRTPQGS